MDAEVSDDIIDAVAIAIASGADAGKVVDSLHEQRELHQSCGSYKTAEMLDAVEAAILSLCRRSIH